MISNFVLIKVIILLFFQDSSIRIAFSENYAQATDRIPLIQVWQVNHAVQIDV